MHVLVRGDRVNSATITPWALIKQMLSNMFPARKKQKPTFRTMFMISFFTLGYFGQIWHKGVEIDRRVTYPEYSQLIESRGLLSEGGGRSINWRLRLPDNTSIGFFNEFTLSRVLIYQWFFDGDDKRIQRSAVIRWFQLPGSGRRWIAEIELEGKLLADYAQRRLDFYEYYDPDRSVLLKMYLLLYPGLGILIFEFVTAYIQLKRGNNHG